MSDENEPIPFPDAVAQHEPEAVVQQEKQSASARLRAFEDDVFGKDAPRINGEVERGIGSPFSKMTDHQKRHHTSLLNMIEAEKAVAEAGAKLAAAEAAHDVAVEAASRSE